MSLKNKTVLIQDLSGAVHQMSQLNANDMCNHKGWKLIGELPENVCDACMGTGVYPPNTQDTCWHCDGEGIDPTK